MRFLGVFLVLMALAGCASDPSPVPGQDAAAEERARNEASAALEMAHNLLKEAQRAGASITTLSPLLKRSEDAFAKGQYDLSLQLAEQVQQYARTAISRRFLILAQGFVDQIRDLTRLTPEHRAQLADIERAIAAGEGERALELSRQLHGALKAARIEYDVVKGDSLWGISAKPSIYADPYQWPLIYKSNRAKIKDADLIYPGQRFDIDKHPGQGDVDAAVEHARQRGAWSVGPQEASDKAYLDE